MNADLMALQAIHHRQRIRVQLCGHPVEVEIALTRDCRIQLSFALFGQQYFSETTRFSGRGVAETLLKFDDFYSDPTNLAKAHLTNDADRIALFGTGQTGDEAGDIVLRRNTEQKKACFLQIAVDMLSVINEIFSAHQRNLIDYALWHRERRRDERTYEQLITRQACNIIIHTNLLASTFVFNEVVFPATSVYSQRISDTANTEDAMNTL